MKCTLCGAELYTKRPEKGPKVFICPRCGHEEKDE